MALKLANNATSTLAANITSSATTMTVQSDDASLFPSLSTGDWFPVTVVDAAGNMEIMKCTARAGAVLTVTRGQENTSGKAFSAGARVDVRLTVAAISAFLQTDAKAADSAKLNGESAAYYQRALADVASFELGSAGTGDRNSFIDFRADDVNSDCSFRILRAGGKDGAATFLQKGTGDINFSLSGDFTVNGNKVWDAGNFDPDSKQDALGYTPAKTDGSNATGTWDIAISRNAATATTAANATKLNGESASYYQQALEDLTRVEIGENATGDRNVTIDLHADDTNTDRSFGLIRLAGKDGKAILQQVGAGDIDIVGGGDFTRSGSKVLTLADRYVSGEQTITAGGTLTLAHGLGAVPGIVTAELVCKVAEFGYAAGAILKIPIGVTSNSQGMAVQCNSSEIAVKYGSNSLTFASLSASTGASQSLTNANWRLVVRAYL